MKWTIRRTFEVEFYDIASFDHICVLLEPKSVSLHVPERILRSVGTFEEMYWLLLISKPKPET
jgi:hypothetical protein